MATCRILSVTRVRPHNDGGLPWAVRLAVKSAGTGGIRTLPADMRISRSAMALLLVRMKSREVEGLIGKTVAITEDTGHPSRYGPRDVLEGYVLDEYRRLERLGIKELPRLETVRVRRTEDVSDPPVRKGMVVTKGVGIMPGRSRKSKSSAERGRHKQEEARLTPEYVAERVVMTTDDRPIFLRRTSVAPAWLGETSESLDMKWWACFAGELRARTKGKISLESQNLGMDGTRQVVYVYLRKQEDDGRNYRFLCMFSRTHLKRVHAWVTSA